MRKLYEQGKEINGAGINASFAIHQDVTGNATDYALGWSVAIGAPVTFQTTLAAEYKSDLFGERGVLLGGLHGIVESLYRWFVYRGSSPEQAYIDSVESITGPITERISKQGMLAVYQMMNEQEQNLFKQAYSAAYHPLFEILLEIYDEVELGNEVRSVMVATARHQRYGMGNFDTTQMWQVGTSVRASRSTKQLCIHPITAGIYVAAIMAQADLLKEKGHSYSEITNESIIESVDSLNPYLHHQGIAFINNCSTTARLGTRKWAPRFDYILWQQAFTVLESNTQPSEELFNQFLCSDIHQVLSTCAQLRPAVSISVFA